MFCSIFKCDGCLKEVIIPENQPRPSDVYLSVGSKNFHACSKECASKAAQKLLPQSVQYTPGTSAPYALCCDACGHTERRGQGQNTAVWPLLDLQLLIGNMHFNACSSQCVARVFFEKFPGSEKPAEPLA